MDRRTFMQRSGCILGGIFLQAALPAVDAQTAEENASQRRPNVLFIAIEDVSPHRFGCWGSPIGKTPAIDAFAARALRFDLAHTMAPPCNPSRTSLFLGLRPETTGVYGNNEDWRKRWGDRVTMPQVFRQNGYETVRIGKMYHAEFEHEDSWSRLVHTPNVPRRTPPIGPGTKYKSGNPGTQPLEPGREKQPPGAPFLYGSTGLSDLEDGDGQRATAAIEELNQLHDRPQFLALGLHSTHLPFPAPERYYALYDPETMPVQEDVEQDLKDMPVKPDLLDHHDMTLREKKEAMAAHFAALSYVDSQLGRVLEALEQSGRGDNTIVVIWSDHGFLLGEHGHWRKGALYDEGVMVALLMRAPGVTTPGSVCTRPVESVDLFPTLFDLCGIPLPDQPIEGVSMRPLLENPQAPWKAGAVTRNGRNNRSIRTERHRYSEYGSGSDKAELFDHESDPLERRNLATDPAQADLIKELSGLLNADWRERLPTGLVLPPQAISTF